LTKRRLGFRILCLLLLVAAATGAPALPWREKEAGPNGLKRQKSPYLLQHADNLVHWRPWGEEAFREAKAKDKLIFLSIGYSTCHWCHVMEEESFQDPRVATLLNESFISILVDREERPDLDDHYMAVSQLMTGTGGWPLTIVMTPERKPFFAATYIPRDNAYGRLGMLELLPRVTAFWEDRRTDVLSSAQEINREIGKALSPQAGGGTLNAASIELSAAGLGGMFDSKNGGFGSAPKFPMANVFPLLMRSWRRTGDESSLRMTEQTLTAMRNGGIYDQLGFGFHRYAIDANWLVPHFEKMLYDQALLALAYTEAWQATGRQFYRQTATEILTYVMRDLTSPEGAFYSAEDADSEGEEGRFYFWSATELRSLLGEEEFAGFSRRYFVSDGGNFDLSDGSAGGLNILHRHPVDTSPAGADEQKLLAARGRRIRPARDDKILADWNGLMIAAFARAGGAFEEPAFTAAAAKAASFAVQRMSTRDGRLLHRYRDGELAVKAFADDYAFLAWGLLELYEASFEPRYLRQAIRLIDRLVTHYWDESAGGFFQTAGDAEQVGEVRSKSLVDGVLPSANSVALLVLAKLGRITGSSEYEKKAEAIVRLYPTDVAANPIRYAFYLAAMDFLLGPSFEVVIAGDPRSPETRAMVSAIRQRFVPNKVLMLRPSDASKPEIVHIAPFTSPQLPVNGKATAYVCRNFACELPTNDIATMLAQLGLGR
jgi:hypothetical protein